MNYPSEILPNLNYKLITCDLYNHYLIRFTATNKIADIFDEQLNQVKQGQICHPSEGMNDLSTSLLGVFKPSFIQIALTVLGSQKYNCYCKPDDEVEIPVFNNDFTLQTSRGFWVVLIGDINNITADYTQGNISTKFKATCVIQHTPMKWNYWHFSIRWKTDDQGYWHELDEKRKRKLGKRLAHESRANIAKFAKVEKPRYRKLNTNHYCKSCARCYWHRIKSIIYSLRFGSILSVT